MLPVNRRELVISALNRGKEQSKRYEFKSTPTNLDRFGSVAVLYKADQYYVLIQEVFSPSAVDHMEFDVDDRVILPDLPALEELLAVRLGLRLENLGPSRGNRHFTNNNWPMQNC